MPDPIVDYARLKSILASPAAASLPPALRARMTADVAEHDRQMYATRPDDTASVPKPAAEQTIVPTAVAPDATAVAGPRSAMQHYQQGQQVAAQTTTGDELLAAIPKAAFQFAHDISLGISPSPYSDDPTLKSQHLQALEPVTKITTGLASMMIEGAGLMKGFSYLGRVPIVTRGLEFMPSRLKEIGIGALINGGLDAFRSEPMARNEDGSISPVSWLDPSAKIAKPLVEMGVPERVALGMGGGVVGAIMGPILIGVTSGFMKGRARIAEVMTPELQASIKDALGKAGVDVSQMGDKYEAAKTFIKNFRKLSLNEDMSSVMADQLTREQYLSNEIAQGISEGQVNTLGGIGRKNILAARVYPAKGEPSEVRTIAEKLKNGDDAAIEIAANEMAAKVPPGVSLVPIPSSTGDVSANLKLANAISRRTGAPVSPILGREPSESQLLRRRKGQPGLTADEIKTSTGGIALKGSVVLVDNVHTTGATANSARRALGQEAPILVWADDAVGGQAEIDKRIASMVDGRLMAGIFRNNPGGVNVVTGVAGTEVIQVAQDRLGLNLHSAAIPRTEMVQAPGPGQASVMIDSPFRPVTKYDILIARPNYIYPSASEKTSISTFGRKINDRMKVMAREASKSVTAPRSTEAFILADGEPIRGGLNTNQMVEKMKLQKPMVAGKERPDLALKEAGKFVRLDMPEPNKLVIELPRTLTQEQFNAVGRAADAVKFDEITIRAVDGTEQVLKTPIGGLVQDHIAKMVKPTKVGSTITPKMIDQFKRTGVFEGQAVVLPDGTAGHIISKQGSVGYKVKESLTGQVMVVHPKKLTILPTSLSSELQPSNLFTSHLPDVERAALAKLRFSIQQDWAAPIKKYRDFESFANTRGYMSNSLRGGKIELSKVNEGGAETLKFNDIPSAVEWVRKDSGPMAELSNDKVISLLGPDRNLGFIGGGGPPPRFNELVPVDWKRMENTMSTLPTDRGVGFFEELRKPLMPLLRDLDGRYGTQMHKVMLNYQSQQIAKQNFEALWWRGQNGRLPNGVKPLEQIIREAGANADRELIFDWRESDLPGKVALEKRMTKQEVQAGKDLAHWFDNAYPALGIDAPFVENYMPRYREWLQKGGTDFGAFLESAKIDPLNPPKGVDFISDHIREGLLDVYEKDPFKVAVQYLRAGSKNRFMKQVQDEAREMVRMISTKNSGIALPLAQSLQAMGGYEFAEQRAMLNETFQSFLDKFPGQGTFKDKQTLADRMVNFFSGAVYSSTMGFRPSLALRNAKDVMVMAYPLYGGPRFYEAIGKALTVAGKEEAMAARAIGSQGGMLTETVEEFASQLPPALRRISDASTRLYEDADKFTRAATFHAAKAKAEDALANFAKRMTGVTDDRRIAGLKAELLRDSKVYIHGTDIEDEFLRRAGTSPDAAAQFAGKVASDMTNFLYGRGMQARWMRSTAGRFLGQFGSWSMWYLDYLTRLTNAVAKGPNRADAAAMLGRHALVNAAIVATGKQVLNVDLSRWASYGALFYSGGPGWTIATGASTLWRGLGEQSSFGEDPLAKSRVTEGASVIWHTLPSFVPFMFAGKDVLRMSEAYDGTELLAATLGTRPTQEYIRKRRLEILLGAEMPPFQSTSGALAGQLNSAVGGTDQQPVDIRTIPAGAVSSSGGLGIPSGARAQQPGGPRTGQPQSAIPSLVPAPSNVPPSIRYRQSGTESTRPADAKPPKEY